MDIFHKYDQRNDDHMVDVQRSTVESALRGGFNTKMIKDKWQKTGASHGLQQFMLETRIGQKCD